MRNKLRFMAYVGIIPMLMSGAHADTWHAAAGAQSSDKGKQALAFLSNELWIHAGDSVLWTFPTSEIHTITFLHANQPRPPFPVGCPGTSPSGSMVTGNGCINSGTLSEGASYSVNFPVPGNFKLVCLVHSRMTGSIHGLSPSAVLPYDHNFYERQADAQRSELLSDASGLEGRGNALAQHSSANAVTAGESALLGTPGGSQAAAVMRFLGSNTVVHVGDTVEWSNPGLMVVHTVTFGTEPPNVIPPSPSVTLDPDNVRHAVIGSPNDSVNSGLLGQQNQETVGLPQWPLDVTRFRVTFTSPGTYNYICAIHDDLGMTGRVIVLP